MLQMRNVGLDYRSGEGTAHLLRRVNLRLPPSGLVLVTGPSGSGKTALLRLMAGLESPSRGEITVDGASGRRGAIPGAAWRRRVGIVSPELLLPDREIQDNAALSARLAGGKGREGEDQCARVLNYFAMERLAALFPGELSGGERWVAALACALAREPEVLLADEPAAGLEPGTAEQALALLRGEARRRLVVAFSRNRELFDGTEDMTLLLEGGELRTLRESGGPAGAPPAMARPVPRAAGEALANLTRRGGGAPGRFLRVLCVVLAVCLALSALQGRRERNTAMQSQALAAYPVVISRENVAGGDLGALGDYLEAGLDSRAVSLQRTLAITPKIYSLSAAGTVRQVSPEADTDTGTWTELPEGERLQRARYTLAAGRWPAAYDEAAAVLDSQGNLDRACIDALGLSEETVAAGVGYTDLMRLSYRVVLPTDVYAQSADGAWTWMGDDQGYMTHMVQNSLPLKIVGVLRASGGAGMGGAAYTPALSAWYSAAVEQSELVRRQTADPATDVLTNRPFDETAHETEPEAQREALKSYVGSLEPGTRAALCQRITGESVPETGARDRLFQVLDAMDGEGLTALYGEFIEGAVSPNTLEGNLRAFGVLDAETVTGLRLYAATFSAREELTDLLAGYGGNLTYTDEAAGVMTTGAALMEGDRWFLPACTALLGFLGLLGVCLAVRLPLAGRRREAGVLYALGMPGGGGGVFRWESVILGFLGSLGGGLLAMALTVFLDAAMEDMTWSLPWWQAALTVLAGTGVSALAVPPERGAGD